jgi:hypothetical protein
MGYHVQVGNTTRVDIARADSILNLVSTLDPAVKSELSTFIAEFYTIWANNIPGLLNFHDEAVKVGRTFRKLLTKCPDDAGEMADAFCLAIRQELTNIEDYATERPPPTGPVPDVPTELAAWFQAYEKDHIEAVVKLLRGALPSLTTPEKSNSPRSRTLYFRHKISATVRLYQYAREQYEKHTPKSFARRPNLPAYYFDPAPATVVVQPTIATAVPDVQMATATPSLSEVPKVSEVTYTLESICKRNSDAERKALALKIDAIWYELKSKTEERHYPATCTAIYKLVDWLGMIERGTIARQWNSAFLSRYGVSVSEGIGKYRIENSTSGVFREAVKRAFAFISAKYPNWTRNKDLPAIYQ